jgi:hypothetical protein
MVDPTSASEQKKRRKETEALAKKYGVNIGGSEEHGGAKYTWTGTAVETDPVTNKPVSGGTTEVVVQGKTIAKTSGGSGTYSGEPNTQYTLTPVGAGDITVVTPTQLITKSNEPAPVQNIIKTPEPIVLPSGTKTYEEFNAGLGTSNISGMTSTTLGKSPVVSTPLEEVKPILLTVEKAPTFLERTGTRIKDEGIVMGILGTIGNEAANLYQKVAIGQMRAGDTGAMVGWEGVSNLAKAAPQSIFFTPVGAPLLLASGVEDVVNLATQKEESRIVKQSKALTASGVNPLVSNLISFGAPVAAVVAGGYGTKALVGNFKAAQELKLFQDAPTLSTGLRVEKGAMGADVAQGIKVTQPSTFQSKVLGIKPTTYYSKIEQPFYSVGDSRVVLEGGKGTAFSKSGKNLQTVGFETSGRYNILKEPPKVIAKQPTGEVSRTLEEYQAGRGRVNVEEYTQIKGKLEVRDNLLTGQKDMYFKGVQTFDKSKKSYDILGAGKEGENGLIQTVGGQATKARANKLTGDISILGKIDNVGVIKRIIIPEEVGSEFTRTVGTKKTPFSKTFGQSLAQEVKQTTKPATSGYTKGLLESSMVSLVPATKALGSESILTSAADLYIKPSTTKVVSIKPEIKLNVKDNLVGKTTSVGLGQEQTFNLSSGSKTTLSSGTSEKERSQSRSTQQSTQSLFEEEQTKQPVISRLNEEVITKQPQRTNLIEKVVEKLKTNQGTRTLQLLRTPTQTKIKVPPIIIIPKPRLSERILTRVQENPKVFESYGIRFGKEKSLGKFSSQKGAEESLLGFLKGSLGASGGVKLGTTKLKATELRSFGTGEFKLSKTSPYKIVQREKFRLSARPEVKEINMFKKQSKGKNKRRSIW